MNWIDYTIFIILFFTAVSGLSNGPVIQLVRIISLCISFLMAVFLYTVLSNVLKSVFTLPMASLLSYFIIFGTAFIITYIVTDLIKKVIGNWDMGIGFRLFGALLGILNGLIFCGVIIFGVLSFCSEPTSDKINSSKIAVQLGKGMQTVVSFIPESTVQKIRDYQEERKGKDKISKGMNLSEDEDFKSTR